MCRHEPGIGIAEEQHRLAAHVTSGEIRLAAQPGVDDIEIEPGAGRAGAAVGRLRGVELQRLAAAGRGHFPRLRDPLRRESIGSSVHVGAARSALNLFISHCAFS